MPLLLGGVSINAETVIWRWRTGANVAEDWAKRRTDLET